MMEVAPVQEVVSQETILAAVAAFATAHAANFDRHGKRVFDRLKEDPRGHEALAAVAGNRADKIGLLLEACIEADLLMRTFNQRVAKERQTPKRLNRLRQAIEDLRQFLVEFSRPTDPLKSWAVVSDEEVTQDQRALDHLELMVEARRQSGVETARRLGATKKSASTNMQAAETAAIGWIADVVKHVAGKPLTLTQHAAILADVALGIGEVSEYRTRKSLRTRRKLENLG